MKLNALKGLPAAGMRRNVFSSCPKALLCCLIQGCLNSASGAFKICEAMRSELDEADEQSLHQGIVPGSLRHSAALGRPTSLS